MEATHYNDLSIHVPKKQLDKLISGVLENKYRIFWGFNKGKMILNIYNSEVNNKLIFKRHKGYLELIEAKLKSANVLKVLDNDIDFTIKAASKQIDVKRSNESVYREIDYFLIELSHFQKIGDLKAVENIKSKLRELSDEWNSLN
ncbi:hypothetical protein [Halalkalibacter krulwichiae]|uniref:Uncharacterized protein n=1 Tax=Halalkalibacter krulwichiae TaxID=199441 RepID=A0A1X9MCN5_9BACI|nr:hypothetical protein [Halalkalibacter krulwichiae]ARK30404.1 hypothetical protein BkAM31D_11520 [Halalkalibacter krulwichiae]